MHQRHAQRRAAPSACCRRRLPFVLCSLPATIAAAAGRGRVVQQVQAQLAAGVPAQQHRGVAAQAVGAQRRDWRARA